VAPKASSGGFAGSGPRITRVSFGRRDSNLSSPKSPKGCTRSSASALLGMYSLEGVRISAELWDRRSRSGVPDDIGKKGFMAA